MSAVSGGRFTPPGRAAARALRVDRRRRELHADLRAGAGPGQPGDAERLGLLPRRHHRPRMGSERHLDLLLHDVQRGRVPRRSAGSDHADLHRAEPGWAGRARDPLPDRHGRPSERQDADLPGQGSNEVGAEPFARRVEDAGARTTLARRPSPWTRSRTTCRARVATTRGTSAGRSARTTCPSPHRRAGRTRSGSAASRSTRSCRPVAADDVERTRRDALADAGRDWTDMSGDFRPDPDWEALHPGHPRDPLRAGRRRVRRLRRRRRRARTAAMSTAPRSATAGRSRPRQAGRLQAVALRRSRSS